MIILSLHTELVSHMQKRSEGHLRGFCFPVLPQGQSSENVVLHAPLHSCPKGLPGLNKGVQFSSVQFGAKQRLLVGLSLISQDLFFNVC